LLKLLFLGSSEGYKACLSGEEERSCGERFWACKYGFRTGSQEGEQQVNDALLSRIEQCRKLPLQALRTKYEKLFGESPRSGHKDYLFRRIAWRMQAIGRHYSSYWRMSMLGWWTASWSIK
jgi:hypothetical protein